MVQRGELKLIDVFFVQIRPSPWRQAVDLGNMMLVLALRSDARSVYDAALRYFTPDELAEAFAATRGVASPTQLRQQMKQDGRDLHPDHHGPGRAVLRAGRWPRVHRSRRPHRSGRRRRRPGAVRRTRPSVPLGMVPSMSNAISMALGGTESTRAKPSAHHPRLG